MIKNILLIIIFSIKNFKSYENIINNNLDTKNLNNKQYSNEYILKNFNDLEKNINNQLNNINITIHEQKCLITTLNKKYQQQNLNIKKLTYVNIILSLVTLYIFIFYISKQEHLTKFPLFCCLLFLYINYRHSIHSFCNTLF
jgi:hypothetical protein